MKPRHLLGFSLALAFCGAADVSAAPRFRLLDLGALAGDYSSASAINNAAHVVGEAEVATGSSSMHAFLDDGRTRCDLGTP